LLRNSLAEEFTCPKCASQSVVYPASGNDDEYVTCRGCGAIIATLAQFRRLVARRLMSTGTPVSGC
jgi:transcription elongation factor Elf1